MHEAAQALVGTHDFKPFTVADPEVSSTVRTIQSIAVVREGDRITLTVTADGFLRSMVRRIAGSLIEIGRGKLARGRTVRRGALDRAGERAGAGGSAVLTERRRCARLRCAARAESRLQPL